MLKIIDSFAVFSDSIEQACHIRMMITRSHDAEMSK